MTGTVLELRDPASGQPVRVCRAQLAQSCSACGEKVEEGDWIVAAGGLRGWVHLDHHVRVLMGLEMTGELRARAEARSQLEGKAPGSWAVVTAEMLAALGLAA